MNKRAFQATSMLALISAISVGTYAGIFSLAANATKTDMTPKGTAGSQADADVKALSSQYNALVSKLASDEQTLSTESSKYAQAYQVAVHDDEVLQAMNQQLQNQGYQPVSLPNAPAPAAGVNVNVNSAPPIVQSTSGGSGN